MVGAGPAREPVGPVATVDAVGARAALGAGPLRPQGRFRSPAAAAEGDVGAGRVDLARRDGVAAGFQQGVEVMEQVVSRAADEPVVPRLSVQLVVCRPRR